LKEKGYFSADSRAQPVQKQREKEQLKFPPLKIGNVVEKILGEETILPTMKIFRHLDKEPEKKKK